MILNAFLSCFFCNVLNNVFSYIYRMFTDCAVGDIRENNTSTDGADPASANATSCRSPTGRHATPTRYDIYWQHTQLFCHQASLRTPHARSHGSASAYKMSSVSVDTLLQRGFIYTGQLVMFESPMLSTSYVELLIYPGREDPFSRISTAVFTQDGQCLFRHILRCCINIAEYIFHCILFYEICIAYEVYYINVGLGVESHINLLEDDVDTRYRSTLKPIDV